MSDDASGSDASTPAQVPEPEVGAVPPPDWNVGTGSGSGGSYAFRPGRVLVRTREWDAIADRDDLRSRLGVEVGENRDLATVVALEPVADVESALALLHAEGIAARPDVVFFAVPWSAGVSSAPVTFGGVGGAPVTFGGVGGVPVTFGGVGGAPVTFGGVGGAPVTFGGVGGAPVTFGGVGGVPVTFGGVGGVPVTFGGVLVVPVTFGGAGGGCGCHCCGGGGGGGAHGGHRCVGPDLPGPLDPPRRSTVRKAQPPVAPDIAPPDEGTPCRVVVLDTGFAHSEYRPNGVAVAATSGVPDVPDANQDQSLDTASGHATFIAGIVRRLAPGADVEVRQVLTTFGDASDFEVASALEDLLAEVRSGIGPQVVNLSFAGYSDDDAAPPAAAAALAELRARGVVVVAAAGNDGTCRPAWPAATAGVLAVGALDDDGPAWFTNHGPWVQACAPGVDVLSWYFAYDIHPQPTGDPDHPLQPDGNGWAKWSGTSFAAPIVAGVLARRITEGVHGEDAVEAVVDDPALFRLNGLGTVVNVRPW